MDQTRPPFYLRRGVELGAGAILTGALLLVLALVPFRSSSAGPKGPNAVVTKVAICHRGNSVTNPYGFLTVSINAADGSLGNGNNDHTHHTGPIFDPAASYPPPHNGDQWGDIIPSYQWGPNPADVFPGLNWPAGQAILANDCNVPVPTTTTTTTTTVVPPSTTTTTLVPPTTTTTVVPPTTSTTVVPPSTTTTTVVPSTTTTTAVVLPTSVVPTTTPPTTTSATTTSVTVEGTEVTPSEGTNALAVTGTGDAVIVLIGVAFVALGLVLVFGGMRHRQAR